MEGIANSDCFILRQTDGSKTEIPFLDIQNYDKFLESKMGVLTTILDRFNTIYSGMAALSFERIDCYKKLEHRRKEGRRERQAIVERLKDNRIRIVDQIGDSYSKSFCNDIADLLYSNYGVRPAVRQRLSKEGLRAYIKMFYGVIE